MKKSSARTHKLKLFMARTFGLKVRCRGRVENIDLTFGGAGNQWTTIDGYIYGTYWDYRTMDWNVGDEVEFVAFYEPLMGRYIPQLQADDIKKVQP